MHTHDQQLMQPRRPMPANAGSPDTGSPAASLSDASLSDASLPDAGWPAADSSIVRLPPRRPQHHGLGVVGIPVIAIAVCVATTLCLGRSAAAADPSQFLPPSGGHRILSADMPPGYVGAARNAGRTLCPGYMQPVSIIGPDGSQISLAQSGAFLEPTPNLQAGLLVGGVYRFQVSRIPGHEGAELYPTIELIDRTYPPPGLATRHPILVQIDQEDLLAALRGQMVTRVIYLEDPQSATPMEQTRNTNRPIDVSEFQDALEVADRFGRPLAIVRIGSVAPPRQPELLHQFFFGYPAWAPIYAPETVNATSETLNDFPETVNRQ
ncbi:hypothetical protein K227x_13970 [Rubripirellula lacrimiformis]|uniref:Uncharacterized protein n=1 Tax=Rubripirellula lacrimiformis TaxID=1930273 RepID=A0A517N7P4_9BACT|nr:hypothetical protein [Rubripirellula lacrimiformis]QDT03018.1 hypothetical protein K227x_13970 [Rubripirellula lacrimiformis]